MKPHRSIKHLPAAPRLAAVLVLAAVHAAAGAGPESGALAHEDIRAQIRERMLSARNVCSRFEQERRLSLFDQPMLSEGIMVFEAPDRIRWETTAPYHSLFIADGPDTGQFEWLDGKRVKLAMKLPRAMLKVLAQISAIHQGRLDEAEKDFDITIRTGDPAAIIFTPKTGPGRALLEAIELSMSPDFSETRRVEMREPNGDSMRINIKSEKRGVRLPPGAFDLEEPTPHFEIEKAAWGGDGD